jgi:ubiquinone/menaquinone biosynthesis C-methylase UbiE
MTQTKEDKSHYGIEAIVSSKWVSSRNKISDLYESEKFFFKPFIKKSSSFLDLGCATGGFYNILKKQKNSFKYSGYDVSQEMILNAKKNFNKVNFNLYNGKTIKKKKNSVDMCFSFGTLHHVSNFYNLIDQMIKISKKYILFDLRFTNKKSLINTKNSQQYFFHKNKIVSKIQYNVINLELFLSKMEKYKKKYSVNIYGYPHKPNKTVKTKYNEVITACILINKTENKKLIIDIK